MIGSLDYELASLNLTHTSIKPFSHLLRWDRDPYGKSGREFPVPSLCHGTVTIYPSIFFHSLTEIQTHDGDLVELTVLSYFAIHV